MDDLIELFAWVITVVFHIFVTVLLVLGFGRLTGCW